MRKLGLMIVILLTFALCASGQTAEQLKKADELYNQGREFYKNDQYDKAIESYTKYINIRPNSANAYYNRGLSYYLKGIDLTKNTSETIRKNLNSAIADFSQSIKLEPKSKEAFIYRGKSFFLLRIDGIKFVEAAILDFSKVLKLDANSAVAFYDRGKAYLELNQFEYALADLNKAIRLNPDNADAYFQRGKVYSFRKQRSLAISDFQSSLKIQPNHPYAKIWLDGAEKNRNADQLSNQTKTQPTSAPTWQKSNEEGKAFLLRNEADKAISSFQRALDQFPPITENDAVGFLLANEKAQIQENVAKAYILKKDYKKAAENCISGQEILFKKLTDEFSRLKKVSIGGGELIEISKSKLDVTLMEHDLLISQTGGAIELNKRCLNYFPANGLSVDERFSAIGIGALKVATAEFLSEMLYTTSYIRLSLSQICQGKGKDLCGAASRDNQISKYSNKALEDINKAIETSPALKKLYLQRAEIYRYLGKNDLALADEEKSK